MTPRKKNYLFEKKRFSRAFKRKTKVPEKTIAEAAVKTRCRPIKLITSDLPFLTLKIKETIIAQS